MNAWLLSAVATGLVACVSIGASASTPSTGPTRAAGALPDTAERPPSAAANPLDGLDIEIAGESRAIESIEVRGLRTITEDELWSAVARPTPPFAFADVAALMKALDGTQSFARISPRLRVLASGRLALAIQLKEHPQLVAVTLRGLGEMPEEEALGALLGTRVEEKAPWFARSEQGRLAPGILRSGATGAAQRLLRKLFDSGYSMARVAGELSADGRLVLDVDEGRIAEVRLVGPAPRQWPTLLEALALPPGTIFNEGDVPEAVKRVERALPALRLDHEARSTRALPAVVSVQDGAGATRLSIEENPAVAGPGVFSVDGQRLTLFFEAKLSVHFRISADELLRHTPVGGTGVGIVSETVLFDAKDRIHLQLDTFTAALSSETAENLGDLGDAGGEYEFALRSRVPALRIADLSLDLHGLLDTSDAWRTGRQTSYLDSLFLDREYYWRSGASLGLTLQPAGKLLLGAELRGDEYASLPSLTESQSFSNEDERFSNPPVEEGQMLSVVVRGELHSEGVQPEQIRGLFRTPETSLVAKGRGYGLRTGYQLLATVEVGRSDGDRGDFHFTRLVSDNMAFLATGPESGLHLRLRGAGGSRLPLQKQEALGGWSALRGYDFKEFRGGDWSLLAMVEYRHRWLSAFVDVGSVRQPRGWSGPDAGAGVKVHLDSLPVVGRWLKNRRLLPPMQLAAAWRLDEHARARPSVRLLVGQLF